MAVVTTNLGVVTAYGDAVAAGYTGTKAEWQALMASYATVAEEAAQSASDAETAKNAAVTAKTDAETAKTDAIAAKTAAQTAQTAAETAAQDAEDSAQDAEDSAASIASSASQIAQNTSDITELKSGLNALAFGKNLYGGLVDYYYPVYIPAGEKVTWSLSEGNLDSNQFTVIFYDKEKTQLSSFGSSSFNDRPSRTVTPSSSADTYYICVKRSGNGSTFPSVPMQIEIGDVATEYEEYYSNPKENGTEIDVILKQMTALSTFTVAANTLHSSMLNKIIFPLVAGEEYYIYIVTNTTRTMMLYEYTDVPYGNVLQGTTVESKKLYKFTSANGADYISLFVNSGPNEDTITLYGMRVASLDAHILSIIETVQQDIETVQQDIETVQQDVSHISRFTVAANATHSSTLHRINIDVPAGEYYYMICSGLNERTGTYFVADGEGTQTQHFGADGTFICKKSKYGVTSIGLFVSSGNTQVEVTFFAFRAKSILGYVQEDHDRQFLAKLFNANRKANPAHYSTLTTPEIFTLAHFSDIHGNGIAAQEVQRFKDKYTSYIDDVVCTGDIVLDKIADGTAFWDNNTDGNILICIGNHDSLGTNGWSNPVSQKTLYDTFISPYKDNWNAEIVTDHSYWYKDYSAKKIRLISVDATIFDNAERSAQITWLETALSGAITNGYSVVGLVHFPPVPAYYQKINSNFCALLHGTAGDMSQFAWGTYCTEILDAVDDFIDGGGNFVCWLSGHTHYDLMSYDTRYPKQLFITVTCAFGNADFDERSRVMKINANLVLNTVSVDVARKYIKLMRYGAEWDDCLRHVGSCIIDYSTSPSTVLYQN